MRKLRIGKAEITPEGYDRFTQYDGDIGIQCHASCNIHIIMQSAEAPIHASTYMVRVFI